MVSTGGRGSRLHQLTNRRAKPAMSFVGKFRIMARDMPTSDESFVVVRFRDPNSVDFPYMFTMILNSSMFQAKTLVVPD